MCTESRMVTVTTYIKISILCTMCVLCIFISTPGLSACVVKWRGVCYIVLYKIDLSDNEILLPSFCIVVYRL